MSLFKRKSKELTADEKEQIYTKDFFDMILPSTISFKANYYIVGNLISACRPQRRNAAHLQ